MSACCYYWVKKRTKLLRKKKAIKIACDALNGKELYVPKIQLWNSPQKGRLIMFKSKMKKFMAGIVAAAMLASVAVMPTSATVVKSGSKSVGGKTLSGNIDLSFWSPYGGVNVFYVKANTSFDKGSSGSTWLFEAE
jgi:roadblock/LC7 domain-containing protein